MVAAACGAPARLAMFGGFPPQAVDAGPGNDLSAQARLVRRPTATTLPSIEGQACMSTVSSSLTHASARTARGMLATVFVIVAGCGGGDDDGPTGSKAV